MPGKKDYIIAIDAGTTSIRVFCYDKQLNIVQKVQKEFTQYFPKPGWIEHDPEEIWNVTETLLKKVLKKHGHRIAAIGITNQRETTVVWHRNTGKPVYNAIVWQCRRTANFCTSLKEKGKEKIFQKKTGLLLDAYFSGTKIQWLLNHTKITPEKLLAGTIDTWLIWKLTEGKIHATDYTNASRTLLLNIHTLQWDTALAKILKVPITILPEVKNSQDDFGAYKGIPITGVAGDQQAALYGQGGWIKGATKNTYGTGSFLLMNIGKKVRISKNGLLTTITPDANGKPNYAFEGSVFIGGAIVQWLRDELKVIKNASEIEARAASVPDTNGVYFVPAFAGLGAPHWDQNARGILTGLTRGTSIDHILRAAEEAIAFQVAELIEAMEADAGGKIKELFVDGGAARDNFLMQFQADIIKRVIIRPKDLETTVRGAAMLAGLYIGIWKNTKNITKKQNIEKIFQPKMPTALLKEKRNGWNHAVKKAKESV